MCVCVCMYVVCMHARARVCVCMYACVRACVHVCMYLTRQMLAFRNCLAKAYKNEVCFRGSVWRDLWTENFLRSYMACVITWSQSSLINKYLVRL